MKILIGSTNVSKRKRFQALLADKEMEFLTLEEWNISEEPEENGDTPEENAILKAKFYGQYFDTVICNDSGLYFKEIPITDARQPGLKIRTPAGLHRLDDDEMINYYKDLIRSLGGKVEAYYLDGVAVFHQGLISSFMDYEYAQARSFYMIDRPSEKRHIGWPLDSLSIDKSTGRYFVDRKDKDEGDNIVNGEYRARLRDFLINALRIQP